MRMLNLGGMTGFDRRTAMKTTIVTGAALSMPRALWAAGHRPGLFVVDRRFAVSAAAALDRDKLGITVIDPREEDLGKAWRGRIPRLLEQNGLVMEGVTLWSDLFICQTFARAHGLELVHPARRVPSASAAGLQYWTLAGSGFPYR